MDAIAGVARKYAAGNSIVQVEVIRWNGKYFATPGGPFFIRAIDVKEVHRVGKQVVFTLDRGYMVVHNAMTGYFDWEHEPWTFDYVEGKREATEGDVRVRFHFADGNVLRFHDARLFGKMTIQMELPETGPELMLTPNGMATRHIMTLDEFYTGLQVKKPVKARLMDQHFFSGIGNIYASEACHIAGIDPCVPSKSLTPAEVSVLHSSLRWVVDQCFPQVRYDWLNVYRRTSCGSCGDPIKRVKLAGRSTFFCPRCQS